MVTILYYAPKAPKRLKTKVTKDTDGDRFISVSAIAYCFFPITSLLFV
jgi:hypothetical protein